ncbi:MAG TPA: ShlB/FhaC/HecB family hemolysin secretion/activation protein [Verrucomicrobia bacterium]|nr:ShlB/FhaC/HecB family hemolysin secretion/activation protein [Verrucomicrobiota bacterium]
MRLRFESIKPSCVSGICRLALALVAFVPMGVSQEGVLPPLKDLGIVGDEPAEIVLKGVEFDGNTVFSDAELLELVKERLGKKVSIEELEGVRKAVSKHYVDHRYVNSGAVIDEQDMAGGILKIRIVEGYLDAVNVMNEGWLRSGYLRKRVHREVGKPLNLDDLKLALELIRRDDKIRKINTALVPGDELGQSHLDMIVTEKKVFDVGIGISNRRPPSVGAEEAEMFFGTKNLTSLGDTLRANYTFTQEGMREIDFGDARNYSVFYSLPLTRWDTTLELGLTQSDYAILEEPFDALDIQSDTRMYSVALRQPIYRDFQHEFSVTLKGEHRRSEVLVSGERFSISPGSVNGQTRITALRISPEYVYRSQERVIAARTTFSFGLDKLDPIMTPDFDRKYFTWMTQASWVESVTKNDTLLIVKLLHQYTDQSVVSMEQFSLGGMNTIRGYRENQLIRDNALVISPELRIPVYKDRYGKPLVYLIPFFDFGTGWNTEGPKDRETIYSAGLGVTYNPSDYVNMAVYWGHAFKDFDIPNDDDLQDYGIHFQLRIGTDFWDPTHYIGPQK